jgi:hypothetical protein
MNLESVTDFMTRLGVMPWLNKIGTAYLPIALKLIAILLGGYLLTRLLTRLIARLANRVKLDALSDRVGVLRLFSRVGLPAPSVLLTKLVRVLGLAITIYLAANILQITILSLALGSAVAFLPTLFTAFGMVLLGLLGAEFIKKILVKVLAAKDGLSDVADIVPQGVYASIMVLTLAMAAQQLGLDISLINRIIVLTVIGVSIGIVGSIGLGAAPLMRQLMGRYHAQRTFELEDVIEFEGERARLVRFAPMVAILEIDAPDLSNVERLFIPYHTLITSHVVRERVVTLDEPEHD